MRHISFLYQGDRVSIFVDDGTVVARIICDASYTWCTYETIEVYDDRGRERIAVAVRDRDGTYIVTCRDVENVGTLLARVVEQLEADMARHRTRVLTLDPVVQALKRTKIVVSKVLRVR